MTDRNIPYKKPKLEEDIEEPKQDDKSVNKEETVQVSAITITSTAMNNPTNVVTAATTPQQRPKLKFKNPKFSYIEPGGKKFVWKSLKQIVTQEKSLPWPTEVVLYNSLNAPPSLKPAKKYSDISGLEATYTDPQTKLHYHNAEEFRIIRTLPSDIIQGYLALRGATNIVDNSLNAPPSLKPAKKYSDISGLEATYTDPQTKLHYHNAEEFRIIRTLPSDIIQGYLALRGATNIVG